MYEINEIPSPSDCDVVRERTVLREYVTSTGPIHLRKTFKGIVNPTTDSAGIILYHLNS